MQKSFYAKTSVEQVLSELNIENNPSALHSQFEHGPFAMDKESMIDNQLVDIKSTPQY